MAATALILKYQIRQAKAILADIRKAKADFEVREHTISEQLDRADLSDDEAAQIEADIAALEKETADNVTAVNGQVKAVGIEGFDNAGSSIAEQETKLTDKISELEAELAGCEERSKAAVKADSKGAAGEKTEPEKRNGGFDKMTPEIRKGFFKGYTRDQVTSLVKRDDVSAFLGAVRSCKGKIETRGVNNTGLTIPDILIGTLADNIDRYSKLLRHVREVSLRGKGRQNILGAFPEAVWVETTGALNELEFGFSQVEVDGFKVGGFIAVPNPTLEDSDENLVALIMDALAQAIGKALDKAILYGNGSKMPIGIVTRLATASQPAWWGTYQSEFTDLHSSNIIKFTSTQAGLEGAKFFAELCKVCGVPKENYSDGRIFWAMNRKTKAHIMAKAVTMNAAGAITAQVNDEMPIVGGRVETLDFMADGDIVGGFGSLFLLINRKEIKMGSTDQARFIEDQTLFKATARYDGKPVFGEGFVAVNILGNEVKTTIDFAEDTANT